MSNPRPESRIKSLEQRATDIEADIIELSSDQAEELKTIRKDIKQGYIDIGKALDSHAEGLMQEIRTRFNSADQRLTAIETTMATKEDLASLKTTQDTRFDKVEGAIAELKGLVTQLLQQKSGE